MTKGQQSNELAQHSEQEWNGLSSSENFIRLC